METVDRVRARAHARSNLDAPDPLVEYDLERLDGSASTLPAPSDAVVAQQAAAVQIRELESRQRRVAALDRVQARTKP